MANSRVLVKLVLLVVMAMAVAAPMAEALTCKEVLSSIMPCIRYLKSRERVVTAKCCNGIRNLNAAANNPVNRKAACNCLKSAAQKTNKISPRLAAGLPTKCGFTVPYPISLSTNCNSVH